MSNQPPPATDRPLLPWHDWLESGWILEDPAGTTNGPPGGPGAAAEPVADSATEGDVFLIGGGVRQPLDFSGLERATGAVWAPDFFSNEIKPFSSDWSARISRGALLEALSENFPGSTKSSKVHWTGPIKSSFEAAFKRIQTAFREDGVKKAVPAVFVQGLTATNDPRAWLAHRLRAGLEGTQASNLRLYGLWQNGAGFLGATPEALFTRNGSTFSSMAVAGTRTLNSVGAREVGAMVTEFARDPKELHEHELVVRDISAVFSDAQVSFSRSKTRVENFGALWHLVTDFIASDIAASGAGRARSIVDWVRAFHPTPALGTAPRDPTFALLTELHALGGDGVARENFGAPFLVKCGERVDAVVAIRQIRWSQAQGDDRIRLVIGSGCGVVPESNLEREWSELRGKRGAVMRLFRLSPEAARPVFWSLEVLERILEAGVRRFVVCAGARNAPLVVALEALKKASSQNTKTKIIVESFFEERAAGFYALGLARSLGEPVAVVTTSGTAVAELLPAVVEADFSGVPLIAITADRPRRLRLSGAPQAIPQNQIFSSFVEHAWDLEEGDAFLGIDKTEKLRPLHLNVCFEEPLLADAEREPDLLQEVARMTLARIDTNSRSILRDKGSADHSIANSALAAKLKEPRLIALVGGLASDEREAVANFLVSHAIPALLEAPSGLRGDPRLAELELCSGDRLIQKLCLTGELEHVLRLGGVPTTRVWRDLDEVTTRAQTLSISKLRFSGLGRGQFIQLPAVGEFATFIERATRSKPSEVSEVQRGWLREDRKTIFQLEARLATLANSEPGLVRQLSELIPDEATVYVGNSLPIRWWDLAATRKKVFVVEANRGVNGIDGQISTALGLAAGARSAELWILVGDLTALYDLAAPWALTRGALSTAQIKIRIVILNNSGGRIFKHVLANAPGGSAPFENDHSIGFKNWAAMWNLDYARVMNPNELSEAAKLSDRAVIEIVPSPDETSRFWTEQP